MVNEFDTALVNAVNVSVDVNSVTVGPIIRLVDVEFIKTLTNLDFVDVFGDVNHLSGVLYQSTVLPFRGFVGAQTAPLGGVEVTGFEVRLATDQWRGHATHVGECSKVGRSVQKLADT